MRLRGLFCGRDFASGIPPSGRDFASGIPHFAAAGDFARPVGCAFPTLLAGGALATTGKKLKECLAALFVFCTTSLCLQKQAFDARSGYKKSPQALLESFFSVVAVRGGFEPPVRLPVRQFSKLVVSATHPSHLSAQWVICLHKRFGTAKIC